jgi:hypothetical protein
MAQGDTWTDADRYSVNGNLTVSIRPASGVEVKVGHVYGAFINAQGSGEGIAIGPHDYAGSNVLLASESNNYVYGADGFVAASSNNRASTEKIVEAYINNDHGIRVFVKEDSGNNFGHYISGIQIK